MDAVSKFNFTVIHHGCRACHVHMVVVAAPFNVKFSAVHAYYVFSLDSSRFCRSHCRGARPSAASHCYAASTLPYARSDFSVSRKLSKLNVAAFRKTGVTLKNLTV